VKFSNGNLDPLQRANLGFFSANLWRISAETDT